MDYVKPSHDVKKLSQLYSSKHRSWQFQKSHPVGAVPYNRPITLFIQYGKSVLNPRGKQLLRSFYLYVHSI